MWKLLRNAQRAYKAWKALPEADRERYSDEVNRIRRLVHELGGSGAVRFMEGSEDEFAGTAAAPRAGRDRSVIMAELTQAVSRLSAGVAGPAGRFASDSLPRSVRLGGRIAGAGLRRLGKSNPTVSAARDRVLNTVQRATQSERDAPRSIASYRSKSEGLLDWSRAVVAASGVPPTPELVHDHARMAAGGLRFQVFLMLGAPRGIDDLARFFPGDEMPDGDVLETFDPLYEQVVQVVGDARLVDDAIDACLAQGWNEFIRGLREHHG